MHLTLQPVSRCARRWSTVFAALFSSLALAQPPAAAPTAPVPAAPAAAVAEDLALTFDPPTQIYRAKSGELDATLIFRVTNVSAESTWITDVKTSCGCTLAKLPSQPWLLASGASGNLELTIDLRGKTGTLVKSATLETRRGVRTVVFQVILPPAPPLDAAARARNLQLAATDRQAVFTGDCVRCHVTPTAGLSGEPLYKAACGICHAAEHRASMVPDLAHLGHPTNRDYWLALIVAGKPGTLMPGFSADLGGPLTKPQIESIASYLTATHPNLPAAAVPAPAAEKTP